MAAAWFDKLTTAGQRAQRYILCLAYSAPLDYDGDEETTCRAGVTERVMDRLTEAEP